MRITKALLLSCLLSLGACSSGGGATATPATAPATNSAATPSVTTGSALYPGYNTSPAAPDSAGMGGTAVQIAGRMKLGWNIGNTLEAIGGETAWGNPTVTKELIQLVKASGFDAIRIPVSWNQHADQKTAKIDPAWIQRVRQVVQYCVDNNMYVIVNIHWDGGWLENNVVPEKQVDNNARQKALWEQIATQLRDFDERLIFAGTNEPNAKTAEQMKVLLSYHQTFVDAVRSTGGKNAHRVLVVQGPETDIEKTDTLWTTMPTDSVANKLMAEVHFYTPYGFALQAKDESWGKQFYYWGKDYHSSTDVERNATWGEEAAVDQLFRLMKLRFVDKGIPVILGEFGAMRRDNLTGEARALHLASRAYYLKYVTRQAAANGLVPFYWDSGALDNFGSGIFNRRENTVFDRPALDAMVQGAGKP